MSSTGTNMHWYRNQRSRTMATTAKKAMIYGFIHALNDVEHACCFAGSQLHRSSLDILRFRIPLLTPSQFLHREEVHDLGTTRCINGILKWEHRNQHRGYSLLVYSVGQSCDSVSEREKRLTYILDHLKDPQLICRTTGKGR